MRYIICVVKYAGRAAFPTVDSFYDPTAFDMIVGEGSGSLRDRFKAWLDTNPEAVVGVVHDNGEEIWARVDVTAGTIYERRSHEG